MKNSSEPLVIRTATLSDASALAELSNMLGYPASSDVMEQRLGRLTVRSDNVVLVAAAVSGEILGWIHGAEQESLESGQRCEILALVVDAQYRGGGVGRRLVAAVEEWALSRSLLQVIVRSNANRLESHPFYERLGYERSKTQHAYQKQL
jgi:GNAT superfamily N-acetyltransferase